MEDKQVIDNNEKSIGGRIYKLILDHFEKQMDSNKEPSLWQIACNTIGVKKNKVEYSIS